MKFVRPADGAVPVARAAPVADSAADLAVPVVPVLRAGSKALVDPEVLPARVDSVLAALAALVVREVLVAVDFVADPEARPDRVALVVLEVRVNLVLVPAVRPLEVPVVAISRCRAISARRRPRSSGPWTPIVTEPFHPTKWPKPRARFCSSTKTMMAS